MTEKQSQSSCLSHALLHGVKVNLEDVLLSMMCDFQQSLNMLPERFSVKEFLESVINDKNDD